MNGISTNWGAERIYSRKSSAVPYENDGTFAPLISESQTSLESRENNFDFSDMYVRTYQHSAEEAVKDLYAVARPWMNTNYLQVPVAGDLDELMESIEKGLEGGESLRDILQNRIDKYAKECGIEGVVGVGGDLADIILVDPDTGKVIDSLPKGRCIVLSKEIQDMDHLTVKSEADDLATFLRYTVLKKGTDDPEKVSALITELKEKQSNYDTTRFLPIFSVFRERGEKNLEYWHKLLGTDGLNWESMSDDERDDVADVLMKIIEEQFNPDRIDSVKEEIDMMNSPKPDISRVTLEEILNG